ncbi:hypothetical protein EXIGLDRAFT_844831 [Exidia glandulosa HHB12029]|uniref:F-box domain-containing protein n=1 Tax=Exidia glandulosa HHB12029 TaxID=1314781 RepID=A0A165BSU2_EXIGL|nr:hypothetical protein EXIGLDRAFT_844831 [Exidia glandulosa HHB12029]
MTLSHRHGRNIFGFGPDCSYFVVIQSMQRRVKGLLLTSPQLILSRMTVMSILETRDEKDLSSFPSACRRLSLVASSQAISVTLPSDVLTLIFDYLSLYDIALLRRVNFLWNDAAIHHARYWRRIDVNLRRAHGYSELTARVKATSTRPFRLSVDLDHCPAHTIHTVLRLIAANMSSLLGLSVAIRQSYSSILLAALDRPAPLLAELDIDFPADHEAPAIPLDFLGGHSLNLVRVALKNVSLPRLPLSIFLNVKRLALVLTQEAKYELDINHIATLCPRLACLTLEGEMCLEGDIPLSLRELDLLSDSSAEYLAHLHPNCTSRLQMIAIQRPRGHSTAIVNALHQHLVVDSEGSALNISLRYTIWDAPQSLKHEGTTYMADLVDLSGTGRTRRAVDSIDLPVDSFISRLALPVAWTAGIERNIVDLTISYKLLTTERIVANDLRQCMLNVRTVRLDLGLSGSTQAALDKPALSLLDCPSAQQLMVGATLPVDYSGSPIAVNGRELSAFIVGWWKEIPLQCELSVHESVTLSTKKAPNRLLDFVQLDHVCAA